MLRTLMPLLVLGILLPGFAAGEDAVKLQPDSVLVSRGSAQITLRDFEAALQRIPEEHRRTVADHPERMARMLEELVKRRLVANVAREAGMQDDPRVAAEIRQEAERVLAREQLDRVVSAAASPDLEQQAREYYLTNRGEFEVEEAVIVCHVLVATKDRTEDEARERAAEVYRKASEGQDFSKLVAEYSDDPTAGANSGCLGWTPRGRMVDAFEDAAFALEQPGEVSEPVQTRFGYHVIQLKARREAGTRSFERVRDELVQRMRKAHEQRVREQYVQDLLGENPLEAEPEVIGALRDRYRHEAGESE